MDKQKLPPNLVDSVKHALAEDVGSGDITAQLIAKDTKANAQVISREQAILCGTAWFEETFKQLDSQVQITWYVKDGETINPNQLLCKLTGSAQALLTGERTALNFLQLLSGTATQVRYYVETISGTHARILDTRKTLPGLRHAQKYAVRCGGGTNHRMGLYDAFLIKENHILAAGSITKAIAVAKHHAPDLPIEIEVETLEQIKEALQAGADSLLLDNFTLLQLREAVTLVQGRLKLEASGGVTLKTIRAIAETGIDFISVGAMTKNIRAVDLSMRMQS
ncbi:carboxylating nicotinate-nucleotide diphosphorylase [Candidatus Parabeggiatoa sp. HSG14]|uniref:carboxylating nicotinate-nucleotide diphosphorylase n=1 Tax=Candidatus Parabeggiatoa sp. HSG14 TaxID=3055593 RepID=UPI0025A775F8|nr:carboxylating nicotinate-nucleotide diphosphorylase [Thiotrichales bacterium HSG14]